MSEAFIAFTLGVVVGAFFAGVAFGGAYVGFIVNAWKEKRENPW